LRFTAGQHTDYSLGDDGLVVTSAAGVIIQ